MHSESKDKEYFIIDRLEGAAVVVQSLTDGEIFIAQRDMFGDDPLEGNVIYMENGLFNADLEETAKRRANMQVKVKKLFGRGKKGK